LCNFYIKIEKCRKIQFEMKYIIAIFEKNRTIQNIFIMQNTLSSLNKTACQTPDGNLRGIIGAVIGDIAGSRLEFQDRFAKYNFKMFGSGTKFTDDSIMTVAIADALMHGKDFQSSMLEWGHRYPNGGYAKYFRKWLKSKSPEPYNSQGNGSGMRVSAVGFAAETLDEALALAKETALPTHGSKDGIEGAQAIAAAIFLAKQKTPKAEIKKYIETTFSYYLDGSTEDIQKMVPQLLDFQRSQALFTTPFAITAFLKGNDYEDVIRTAATYGCDTDTVACMAGGIAAAYYGVPLDLAKQAADYISDDLLAIINEFDGTSLESRHITPKDIHEWSRECVIVYGRSVNEGENGEKGSFEAHDPRHPREGYAIRTIGADFKDTSEDVKAFISYVGEHPEKVFLVMQVGIHKAGIPVEEIAPLFEPLRGKSNVYLPAEYIAYYDR
jgi:ADP-ribosyl-[dinitrogen reductase] hydrolase